MSVELVWDAEAPTEVAAEGLVRAAQAALAHGGRAAARIDLIVVTDQALAELHGRFLHDDSPTDVMAFDLGEEPGGPAGEVYVSLDCARRVAHQRGAPLERELALYVVHGCLHLCGYDDHAPEERARMRAAEAEVLDALGYPRDDAPHEQDA